MESQSPPVATDQSYSSQASEAVNSDAFVYSSGSDALALDDSVPDDILGSEVPRVRRRRRPDPIFLESPPRRTDLAIDNEIAKSYPTTSAEVRRFFKNPASNAVERSLYPFWQPSIWDPRWQGYCPRKIDFVAESADENATNTTPTLQIADSRRDPWLFLSEYSPTPAVSICSSIATYSDASDDDAISMYSDDSFDEFLSKSRDLKFVPTTDLRGGPPGGHNNPFHNLKSPAKKGTPTKRNSAQRESWRRSLRNPGTLGRRATLPQENNLADDGSQMEENVNTITIAELEVSSTPQTSDRPDLPTSETQDLFWTKMKAQWDRIHSMWRYFLAHGGWTTLVVFSWIILLILAQTNILRFRSWGMFNPDLRDQNSQFDSALGQS
ncbi:hypothetical protein TWF696_002247 [Orbilia brochopaga]|uniref:Uncharacterized protein n=1 Tax=Orbilia brochopaga TaxID=3140254 RepID=A0AAV9U7M1_9PEZI